MFADLVGSTHLVEHEDPERAIERIAEITEFLSEKVHGNDGIVNRIEGDGLMALFGAPIAREDHAVCACQAAMDIQRDIHSRFTGQVRVRIGLCSGNAVLHAVQNDLSTGYEADGLPIILARRMEQMATPGETYFTGDMAGLVRTRFSYQELGENKLKGMRDSVPVYRLTGLIRDQSTWPGQTRKSRSKFVGRLPETDTIRDALLKTKGGAGQVLTITGEPGVGKSRLLYRFLRSGATNGVNVWDVSADRQHQRATYRQVSNILRPVLSELSGGDPTENRTHLYDQMTCLNQDLAPSVRAIASLLDLMTPQDKDWHALDAQQQRGQIVQAFTDLLVSMAIKRPCIAVFENAQWMDAGSLAVLDHLVRHISEVPILVILTLRPEIDFGWTTLPHHTNIGLEPLGRDEFNRFADHLLGTDESLTEFKSELFENVRGVPLFLEELVRSFEDRGIISGQTGKYLLEGAFDVTLIPPRVQNVMATRIDALSIPAKTVLTTSAVIGSEIDPGVLQAVSGIENAALKENLSDLVDRNLLRLRMDKDQASYVFCHDLMREVAYRGLLRPARKQLHSRALKALEVAYEDRLDDYLDRLAEHAYFAEDWPKAAGYQLRFMVRAVRRWANLDAVAIFDRGIEALTHLPRTPKTLQMAIDFRLLASSAMTPLGRHKRQIELLTEADAIASSAGDAERGSAVNCQLAAANWVRGDQGKALQIANGALDAARSLKKNTGLELTALYCTGMIHHETGRLDAAIETLSQARILLTDEFDNRHPGWPSIPSVSINTFLASTFFELGDIDQAEILAGQAVERADSAKHAYTQTMAHGVYSRVLIERGRLDIALDAMQRNLSACRRFQIHKMYPFIAARLVEVHVARKEFELALETAAIPENSGATSKENFFGWTQLSLAKGQALLGLGQVAAARNELQDCLQKVVSHGEQPKVANCWRLLGDVSAREGDPVAARAAYSKSREVSYRIGMQLCYRRASSALESLAM